MKRYCSKLVLLLASLLALDSAWATDHYWNTAVGTGYWTDPASWCTDAALTQPATSYPKSTGDKAYFNANTEATVLMTNRIAVGTLDLSKANLKLTFKADGPAKGEDVLLTMNSLTPGCTGSTIILDGAGFYRGANLTFGANSTWKFLNGAYFKMTTPTFTSTSVFEVDGASTVSLGGTSLPAGMALSVKDKSQLTFNGNFSMDNGNAVTVSGQSSVLVTGNLTTGMSGQPSSLTIDDSSFLVNGAFYIANKDSGGDVVLFKGVNPKLTVAGGSFSASSARTNGAFFNFEVPAGGFAEPPLQYLGTATALNNKLNYYFNVLAASPALASGAGLTECPLFFCHGAMTRTTIVFTHSLNAAGASALSYKQDQLGSADAIDDASAHCIWATLGSGAPAQKPEVARSTGVAAKAHVAVARRTYTVTSYVTALATAGKTVARLFAGETSSGLTEALSQSVTEAGKLVLNWTAPEKMLEKTYYFKVVLETRDADDQLVYSEESAVANLKTQDTTVYTWQPVDGNWSGNFSDSAHWSTDTGDDRLAYPQTANAQVVFPKGKMFVTLDRAFTVGTMTADAKDLDLTFVPAEGATTNDNKFTITTLNTAKNVPGKITLRKVNVTITKESTLGRGKTLQAEGAELTYSGRLTATQGALLVLRDSHVTFGGELQLGGNGTQDFYGLWVDNSFVEAKSHIYAGYAYAGGRIRFSGASPVIYSSGKDGLFQSNLDNCNFTYEFEIPEGGYPRAPICCGSNKTKLFYDDTKKGLVYFTILPSSPALAAGGTKTYTLVNWTKGITADKYDFTGVVGPEDSFTATSTQISATIKGAGNAGCVRVAGAPEVGTPTPAYGTTRGHAEGETIACSVAATSFVQDGISYTLAGYVVSNVFDGAESTLLTSGTADSFSYEQPANATAVTWLWTAKPTVVVNITEGGTVDYTTKAFEPGTPVTITATAAKGYTFARWSGDVGTANPGSPTITVTADQARTLRAEFNCVRYVKTDGDDNADGLSWETALASPQVAADRAVDGDEIVIRAGTYPYYAGRMPTWVPPFNDGNNHPYACCLYVDCKDVYIHSENADQVVLDATASFVDPYWKKTVKSAAAVKVLNSPGAHVSGLTLKGGYTDNYELHVGLEANGGTFDHLTILGRQTSRSSTVHLSGTAVLTDSVVDGAGTTCGNEGSDHSLVFLRDSARVERCVIRDCRAGGNFYGLYLATSDVVARNCLVTGCLTGYTSAGKRDDNENTYGAGGAVFVTGGTLESCTITANETKGVGGGVYVAVSGSAATSVRLVNNIIYGNTSQQGIGHDLYGRATCDRGRFYCENCCASEFAGVASKNCLATLPDFTDPENGDYTLSAGSPLVDRGVLRPWMDASATDLAGNPRVFNDVPDMGAYECQTKVAGIGAGITPSAESGRSPFAPTFVAVLSGDTKGAVCTWDFGDGSATETGDTVSHTFVERKTYLVRLTVVNGAGDTAAAERLMTVVPDVCYVSKEGTHEYPFDTWEKAATNVEDAVAVDAALVLVRPGAYVVPQGSLQVPSDIHLKSTDGAAVTILDTGLSQKANEPYRVLTVSHSGAVVEGFTLKHGNTGTEYGPIATMQASAGLIRNCVFTDTIHVNRSQSIALTGTARMYDCVVNGVIADQGNGDAMVNAVVTLDDNAILDTCTVTNFSWGNYAAHPCAPIICFGRSTVRNTLVSGCRVGSETKLGEKSLSSLIAIRGSDVTVENCTLAGNYLCEGTTTGGAAIYVHEGTATIRNNIIWGNETVNSRGSVVFASDKTATVDRNCVQEAVPAGATATITADPLFRGKGASYYELRSGSPCIDAASTADWMTGAFDLRGWPRIIGRRPDLGCYECAAGGFRLIVR